MKLVEIESTTWRDRQWIKHQSLHEFTHGTFTSVLKVYIRSDRGTNPPIARVSLYSQKSSQWNVLWTLPDSDQASAMWDGYSMEGKDKRKTLAAIDRDKEFLLEIAKKIIITGYEVIT